MFFKDNLYIKSVDLLVKDIVMMRNFYETIIGLELISESKGRVELGIAGNVLITLVENKQALLHTKHTGLYHLALLLPKMSDLGKVINHIVNENEYPLSGASNHLVSNAIYLDDPEGNGIEIYADNDKQEWHFTNNEIEMATIPMDVNYIMEIRDTSEFTKLPKHTILGHVHFTVNDINLAKDYFMNTLGFNLLLNHNNHALFLSSNGYHHHIGANIWEGKKLVNRTEYDSGLIGYHLNVKDRVGFIKRLETKGFSVHDNKFKDPYGLLVHIWGAWCKNI